MQKKKKAAKKQQARHAKQGASKQTAKNGATPGRNDQPGPGVSVAEDEQRNRSIDESPIGRVIGLHNRGNTCYFNSLTQVDCFGKENQAYAAFTSPSTEEMMYLVFW